MIILTKCWVGFFQKFFLSSNTKQVLEWSYKFWLPLESDFVFKRKINLSSFVQKDSNNIIPLIPIVSLCIILEKEKLSFAN